MVTQAPTVREATIHAEVAWVPVPHGRHASVCQQVLEQAGYVVLDGGPRGLHIDGGSGHLVADLRAAAAWWSARARTAEVLLQGGNETDAVLDRWSHAQLCAEHAYDLIEALSAECPRGVA